MFMLLFNYDLHNTPFNLVEGYHFLYLHNDHFLISDMKLLKDLRVSLYLKYL